MRARRTSATRLRFNVAEWDRIAVDLGLQTDVDRAAYLGVDPSNYHRVTRGQSHPSDAFIARTMRALAHRQDATFEALFPIVDVTTEPELAS
jgi:hypothetical protein